MEPRLLEVGVDVIKIEGVDIKVFNRDRTICDVLLSWSIEIVCGYTDMRKSIDGLGGSWKDLL